MDARTSFLALSVCVLGTLAALIVLPLVEYVLAACLLAVVLRPLYERLAPRVGERTAGLTATGLAVVGGVIPLVLVSLVVLRTAASVRETTSIDHIAANTGEFARAELRLADGTVAALESSVTTELEGMIAGAADVTLARTVGLVTTAADIVAGTIVLVFVLYYLLVDGPAAVDWIRRHVPLERRVPTTCSRRFTSSSGRSSAVTCSSRSSRGYSADWASPSSGSRTRQYWQSCWFSCPSSRRSGSGSSGDR